MRCVLALLVFAALLRVEAASSLVGWWKFNEGTGTNALDSSGYGNTAHLTNGTTWVTGHEGTGYALSFDGEDDYASIYYSTNWNWNTNFTITAWVLCLTNSRLTAVGGWTNNLWNGFSLEQIDDVRFDFEYQDRTEAGEGAHRSIGSGLGYTSNAWFFVTGVRSNDQVWVYINGDPGSVSTQITNVNALGTPTGMGIGSRCWNKADASWRGYVDDVRVYNRQLSTLEITNLFNGTDPVDPSSGLTMNVAMMNVGSIVPAVSTPPAEENFQVEVTTTTSPQDFIFRLTDPDPVTVAWGDGTTNTYTYAGNTNLTHSYATADVYTIKISGTFDGGGIDFFVAPDPGTGTPELVSAVLTPIRGCTNITTAFEMFKHCENIETLPDDLFSTQPNITSFYDVLLATYSLRNLPASLFDGVNKGGVTTTYAMFDNCSIITNTHPGLLAGFTNSQSSAWIHAKCYALKNVPDNYYDDLIDNTTFAYAHYQNYALTNFPSAGFAYNSNVTTYANCFYNCTNLLSASPTNFAGLKLWELPGPPIGTDCFFNCTNIADYADIPADWK